MSWDEFKHDIYLTNLNRVIMLSIYLYKVKNHPDEVNMAEKETNTNDVEQLRQFKKKSGWSYEKIGERMGVHPQTIVFWITGKHIPSKMAKEKIQRFLDEYFIN